MAARGLTFNRDGGDPYAQGLQELIRTPSPERRVDRLLVAAIIEARSCERLSLLAEGLEDPALRRFYGELAQSTDGHQSLFYRLTVTASGDEAAVKERLEGAAGGRGSGGGRRGPARGHPLRLLGRPGKSGHWLVTARPAERFASVLLRVR
ncbi:tRNA isopentenyl-2-thiomethyl-A-37 hydroxylase MiaE [Stigmatella erecta]|uniref:tRNA isopentenyl-2-thiomethyl-A-37 hydroxylase MiaE n=1 Tax=Stigmatella erecta TaxID=83460 RepID=UPI000A5B48D4|nr:tRNA isopentenyl-2-thiomethyl-A-37 hydroxylase MiaE [Stigmatella erecta]